MLDPQVAAAAVYYQKVIFFSLLSVLTLTLCGVLCFVLIRPCGSLGSF